MTCFIAQNELSAFADDALEMARAAELQAHLSGCSGCTRELQEIRRVRTMLRGLPVHRAPADFLAKVKAKAQRKSFLERAGAAIEPLLRLPRPAQAGLALAASLVIAVTVFINPATKRGSVWDSPSAPGAAISLSEVANVQPTATPFALADSFAKRTNLDGDVAGGEKNQAYAERKSDPADEQAKPESQLRSVDGLTVAQGAPAPAVDARQDLDKSNRMTMSTSTPAPAPTSAALAFRETPRLATPVATPRAVGGMSAGGSMGATGNSSSYTPPTNPGLYSSTPQAIVALATPQPKPDVAKAKAGSAAPSKLAAKESGLEEADGDREPAYESSAAFAADSAPSPSGGDDWGSTADAVVAEEKVSKTRDAKDQAAGKKELRRAATKSAEAGPAAGRGQAGAPAETETASAEMPVVATGSVAVAAPAAEPAAAAAAATVSAKFSSTAASAPQDVVAAARAVGGKLISPASAPPGLGKAGASTVVIVEIPASGVAAFEEKVRLGGTLERGPLPAGAIRYRIEVVRQ